MLSVDITNVFYGNVANANINTRNKHKYILSA